MRDRIIKAKRWTSARLRRVSTSRDGHGSERSEAGDTLIEVLVALIVIGLTCVAVLGAFATTLAATVEHRNLAKNDAVLRSFVETANYDIWLAPSPDYVPCALAGDYSTIASSYVAPTGFTVSLSVIQYLPATSTNGCQNSPSDMSRPTPPNQPQPQLLEATVSSATTGSDSMEFVVSDPFITSATGISPAIAPSGTPVTISGTGFSTQCKVNWGSSTITSSGFTVNSTDTKITVSNPPSGSGNVSITVTCPNGTSLPISFTYFAVNGITSPAPVGATNVTITGTGFTGAQVNFGGTTLTQGAGANQFSVNAAGTQITLNSVPSGTGSVNVTVTNGAYTMPSPPLVFTYLALNNVAPTSGPAGTGLTLNGTGFTGAPTTTVHFGSTTLTQGSGPNQFSVNAGGTQITFPAPSGQSGNISITVSNNGYTTSAVTFNETTSAGNQLIFTTSAVSGSTSSTANLGEITIQRQNGGSPITTGNLTVNLSSLGAGTGVFATTQFGASVGSVTITAGNSTATFWYGNSAVGSPTITAAATGFTSGTQQETITTAPAGLGITLASGSTGTPVISCGTPSTNYTCNVTGVDNAGSVVVYVTFWDSGKNPVVYSATQASTIAETGQNTGSVIIGANASSSNPNTLTAGHSGNSTKTSTLTFGPYTLTINVSS